ncbi:MAG: Gldg family protein, partial [Flavihumibacter sp.]
MKRLLQSRYSWIALLVGLVLINWLAGLRPLRADLTAEKRYTLSAPTKKLLGTLEETAQVDVLLSGDMPAGFRKLANSTNDLLTEFKSYGKTRFQFRFSKPGEGLNDTAKANLYDSLSRLGLHPTNIK